MSISFFHLASVHPEATKVTIENARRYHKDNFYFLGIDGNHDYDQVAEENNCAIMHYQSIGGPIYPNGYD